MKKINLFILGIIISSTQIFAQQEEFRTNHKFGFHAGSTSGIGFSYKFQPKKLGIQLVGVPIFLDNGNTFTSLGLSGLFRLQQSRRIDVFTYLGNNIMFLDGETIYNLGIGAGLDLHIWPNVLDLNVQLGYGIYELNDQPLSLIAGEIGLHYIIKTRQKKQNTGGL